jgi:hypothetical protein
MAQERSHVDEACPDDITGIPNFAPEHFRRVILKNPLKMKQLAKGLVQMAEEGAVQVFRPMLGNDYILGAVGVLQFEVTIDLLHKLCSVWQSTHMRYETVQGLSDEDFRRSTGVQRSTFDTMLKTVKEILRDFGRPPKLSRADQLFLTLMYWREYRTECHTQKAHVIAEMTTGNILSATFASAENMIFSFSKKLASVCRRMFCCWLMPGIRVWLKFTPTARHRSKKSNSIR